MYHPPYSTCAILPENLPNLVRLGQVTHVRIYLRAVFVLLGGIWGEGVACNLSDAL